MLANTRSLLIAGGLSAFATAASADCAYVAYDRGHDTILGSISFNSPHILNEEIPVIQGFDENTAHIIGGLMAFECLRDAHGKLREPNEDVPENVNKVTIIGDLAQQLPIQFRFRQIQGEHVSADVTCENITINFDPNTFISIIDPNNQYETSQLADLRFMGAIIEILAAIRIQSRSSNYIGAYQLSPNQQTVGFTPDDEEQKCQPLATLS